MLLGLASYIAGWQLGWNELMVFAASCLLALAMALGFVVGRHRLVVTRTLTNDRVTVGDTATATLVITNPARTPVGPRQLEDRSGAQSTRVDLSGLGPGLSKTVEYALPTQRRGIIDIGPAVVAKADPLGLMRREVTQAGIDQLWVQPRIVSINPVPVGFAKDLEGPTSDTSPAGDVSFHTLREYSIGDDHRHVHWLSTARTGSLMVRHYVDNRRPHVTVVLDTGDGYRSAADGNGAQDKALVEPFELAVEVAASLAANAIAAQQPFALRYGLAGTTSPLDALTVVQCDGADLTESIRTAVTLERDTSVLVIVTGDRPAESLLGIVEEAKRSTHPIVIRCGSDLDGIRLPGATTLNVADLRQFQLAWNGTI